MAIKAIFHVNVNCSDYEVSKAFYENLGFQSILDLPTGGDARLAEGLAMPECDGRASIMMLDPDQPRQARLDLIEWVNPRDDQAPYDHLARLGINRIALWTFCCSALRIPYHFSLIYINYIGKIVVIFPVTNFIHTYVFCCWWRFQFLL